MAFDISQRARALNSSAIREILKVTEDPSVISFAGGIPSPRTFPIERVREASARILAEDPHAALQYGPTEGFLPLREWVAQRLDVSPEQVLITTGSQQALDLLAKVLIDPGSRVLVENPSYLGALQAFALFEPTFVPIEGDAHGMLPDALAGAARSGARLLYTMPNFQNPTGVTLPEARRRAVVATMSASRIPIIEDDPYGELLYSGQPLPTLLSMNPDGVVYLGSFSKIVAPGLRVGYAVAPRALMHKLVQAKQASDLHTSGFAQRLVHEVVRGGFLDTHVGTIRTLYRAQRDAMLAALAMHCACGLQWNVPLGGMFLWARLPEGADATRLLAATLAPPDGPRVAFVPGLPFYAGAADGRSLRLSFVSVPPARIEEGIAQLARVMGRAA